MKRFILGPAGAFAAFSLCGCVSYNLNHDGIARAQIDETVYVDGPKVTPLAVLEDSRCPNGVQCVWAGPLRIQARIESGSGIQTEELQLGNSIRVADGNLELVEALPEAVADRTIYPEEYRFGFTFSGGL